MRVSLRAKAYKLERSAQLSNHLGLGLSAFPGNERVAKMLEIYTLGFRFQSQHHHRTEPKMLFLEL